MHASGTARTDVSFSGLTLNNSESNRIYLSASASTLFITILEEGRTEIETRKTNHVHTKDLMHSINNAYGKMTNNNPLIPVVPFHLSPVHRPPPKPIKQDVSYPQNSQSSEYINPSFD